MNQYFICDPKDIQSKVDALHKTSTSTDGWTIFYTDSEQKQEWMLTWYGSEQHGGGRSILKRLPERTIEELIEIAISSLDTNNITGAAFELLERESTNNASIRHKILDKLIDFELTALSEIDKKRLRIIINECQLCDQVNRRSILGKHFTEIQEDADYYRRISEKANAILAEVEKYSS